MEHLGNIIYVRNFESKSENLGVRFLSNVMNNFLSPLIKVLTIDNLDNWPEVEIYISLRFTSKSLPFFLETFASLLDRLGSEHKGGDTFFTSLGYEFLSNLSVL